MPHYQPPLLATDFTELLGLTANEVLHHTDCDILAVCLQDD